MAGSVLAESTLSLPMASRFDRLDIQHGLSQATVTALAQDHDGYIWIGTQNGLNRYDGYNVKVFRPDDSSKQTLADNFVSALAVDQQGQVWIGTLQGLNRYNPQQATFTEIALTPARKDSTDAILSLHLDQQNQLWAGTERGLALWQNQQLMLWPKQATDAAPLLQLSISAIVSDNQQQLWLGTPRGLFCVNIQTGAIISSQFPFPQASVMALYFDKDGRLWVGLEHEGLLMRDSTDGIWRHIPLATYDNGVTSKEIRSITMDQQGAVWVGTQHGLNQLKLENGQWQPVAAFYHQRHNPSSLGSGKVAAILAGKYNSIWVGTWNGGVSRLHQNNNLFTSITPDLPLMAKARNPATITLASDADTLWAGTADGLFALDIANTSLSATGDPQESLTFYSTQKLDNRLLFGHTNGIKALDLNSKQYQDLILPDAVP
ncbi:MAG: two-component regulator propeller domain-containing protein, partial [Rheinheimera sp.]|nr:two-component regulator propeller domain-containing protein [Rheinheimera sp.]